MRREDVRMGEKRRENRLREGEEEEKERGRRRGGAEEEEMRER